MAFSSSYHALKPYLLFASIAIICSQITAESKAASAPMNGPFVLVRLKRSPHRAITYSGFNPANGLTAFATSADFLPPYYNYPSSQFGYPVESRGEPYSPSASSSNTSPSDYSPDYQPSAEYPPATVDEDRKLVPSQNLTPPSEQAPNTAYNQNTFQPVKKPKKKPDHIAEDDDEDDATSKSRSTSHASFNAWFPIMLGMYPSRGGSDSYREDTGAPQKEGRYGDRSLGSTVIANSVSHGRSSVASSHAIAYGGDAPMKAYRRG